MKIIIFIHFDVTQDNINFLYQNFKDISKEVALYIREQIFEDVRKQYFPQLPSRQKCLWSTDEIGLTYWKQAIINRPQYILKLQIEGEYFCADDYWLKADTFSSTEYANRAKNYWSEKMSENPNIEYFYGSAIIKEILQR